MQGSQKPDVQRTAWEVTSTPEDPMLIIYWG